MSDQRQRLSKKYKDVAERADVESGNGVKFSRDTRFNDSESDVEDNVGKLANQKC